MIKNIFIFVFAIAFLVMCGLRACSPNPLTPKALLIHDTIKVLEVKTVEIEKEVVKWKTAKSRVHYVTKFDTLATIDTVIVELIKCDQVVKIDSVIIDKLDSLVSTQKIELNFKDQEIKENKKVTRKAKRKAFFNGVAVGAAAVVAVLIAIISL